MLYKETVSTKMWELLQKLMKDEMLKDFNLVGGTALSLQIGHRLSIDIDLFTTGNFDEQELLKHLANKYPELLINDMFNNTILLDIDKIKVDILSHQYPWHKPIETKDGIRLASLEDIGAMKLHAIFQNGTRIKDFTDMYFLLEHHPLRTYLEAYRNKYGDNPAMATYAFGANGLGKTTIFDSFTWLLFGKDSLDRKDFEIKPLDSNGISIPKIENEVEGTLLFNGEEIVLKRIHREKWVKKRGLSEPEFNGNETIYFWNDVPMSAKEYTSKINELLDEQVFKLISNPLAFNNLKWQDRRKVLIDIAGETNVNYIDNDLGHILELTKKKTIAELKAEVNGTTLETLNKTNNPCVQGYRFDFRGARFSLDYEAGKLNRYSDINAKIIQYKPDNELDKKVYGIGLRIKKITYYDKKDPNEDFLGEITIQPTKEINYSYKRFNNFRPSSGKSRRGAAYSSIDVLGNFKNYSDLILYENVSVKTVGLGEIQYTYENPYANNPSIPNHYTLRSYPKKITHLDEFGNITEENLFNYTFTDFNLNISDEDISPKLKSKKITNKTYSESNTNPLELITETFYDAITRNITSKKIINSLLGETFEEQYTYVKYNDSYLPKTVNKFKNGIVDMQTKSSV